MNDTKSQLVYIYFGWLNDPWDVVADFDLRFKVVASFFFHFCLHNMSNIRCILRSICSGLFQFLRFYLSFAAFVCTFSLKHQMRIIFPTTNQENHIRIAVNVTSQQSK